MGQKKNKFQKKNKKEVEKLGKGKKAPKNATVTQFKTRAINVTEPIALKTKSGDVNERNLTLSDLYSKLRHHRDVSRKDAIESIQDFLEVREGLIEMELSKLLQNCLPCTTDLHPPVRVAFLKLIEKIFTSVSPSNIRPFLPLIVAYISHSVTHELIVVQSDGMRLLQLLIRFYPSQIPSSEYISLLLPKIVCLIIQRFKDLKSRVSGSGETEKGSPSTGSGTGPGTPSKKSTKGGISGLTLLLDVFYSLLKLCVTKISDDGGVSGSNILSSTEISFQSEPNRTSSCYPKSLDWSSIEGHEGTNCGVWEWEKESQFIGELGIGGKLDTKGIKSVVGLCFRSPAISPSSTSSSSSSSTSPSNTPSSANQRSALTGTLLAMLSSDMLNLLSPFENPQQHLVKWHFGWTLRMIEILFSYWVEIAPSNLIVMAMTGRGRITGQFFEECSLLTLVLKFLNLFLDLWVTDLMSVAALSGRKLTIDKITLSAMKFVLEGVERHVISSFPLDCEGSVDPDVGVTFFKLNLETGRLIATFLRLLGIAYPVRPVESEDQQKKEKEHSFVQSTISEKPKGEKNSLTTEVPLSWVSQLSDFLSRSMETRLRKQNSSSSIQDSNQSMSQSDQVESSLSLFLNVMKSIHRSLSVDVCDFRFTLLKEFSSFFKQCQPTSPAKFFCLQVVEWLLRNYEWRCLTEKEANEGSQTSSEEEIANEWVMYLPKLLYQISQTDPSSRLLPILLNLLLHICSRLPPSPEVANRFQNSPQRLFTMTESKFSSLQTALVPFLHVVSAKHGGGILGPFLELDVAFQRLFLSSLSYFPEIHPRTLRALAFVASDCTGGRKMSEEGLVCLLDCLVSRVNRDSSYLGSFFSFLSTLLVRRADPSPSQTVTVVSNRKRKRSTPSSESPPLPMNLETEIPLFCNALCSLPQLPHAGGITLLERCLALIPEDSTKSKTAIFSLVSLYLDRTQQNWENEIFSASAKDYLAREILNVLIHIQNSTQTKTQLGCWEWERCLDLFCLSPTIFPLFLENVTQRLASSSINRDTTKKVPPPSPSSSLSETKIHQPQVEEVLLVVNEVIKTSRLHSVLRKYRKSCLGFRDFVGSLRSPSAPSILLSFEVGLGKK